METKRARRRGIVIEPGQVFWSHVHSVLLGCVAADDFAMQVVLMPDQPEGTVDHRLFSRDGKVVKISPFSGGPAAASLTERNRAAMRAFMGEATFDGVRFDASDEAQERPIDAEEAAIRSEEKVVRDAADAAMEDTMAKSKKAAAKKAPKTKAEKTVKTKAEKAPKIKAEKAAKSPRKSKTYVATTQEASFKPSQKKLVYDVVARRQNGATAAEVVEAIKEHVDLEEKKLKENVAFYLSVLKRDGFVTIEA